MKHAPRQKRYIVAKRILSELAPRVMSYIAESVLRIAATIVAFLSMLINVTTRPYDIAEESLSSIQEVYCFSCRLEVLASLSFHCDQVMESLPY